GIATTRLGAQVAAIMMHEIKYDGYRMHARLEGGKAALLTRTGLDWSRRYPSIIEVLRSLPVKAAYLDGELCALAPDGVAVFSRLQAAMDEGRTGDLVFIVFDLLYLNGKSMAVLPLIERKERLGAVHAPDPGAAIQRSRRRQWPTLSSRALSPGRRRRHLE